MANPLDLHQIGENANIDVILKAHSPGDHSWLHAAGYTCKVSRTTTVGEIRAALVAKLSEKGQAVKAFAWNGKVLVDEKTLHDSGVTLPGPAARRAGAKLEILFAVDAMVTEKLDASHKRIEQIWSEFAETLYSKLVEQPRVEILQKAREKRRIYQQRIAEETALGKWIETMGTSRDFKLTGPYVVMRSVNVEKECWVGSGVLRELSEGDTAEVVEVVEVQPGGGTVQRGHLAEGGWLTIIDYSQSMQYARFAGVRGLQEGDGKDAPRHFFERVPDEVRRALEILLTTSDGGLGSGVKVLDAFHVDNADMRYRYEKLKERMRSSKEPMKTIPNRLTKVMENDPSVFDLLGKCDASINETRLWHGTDVRGVQGISNNGWDVNYCVNNAYGLGFYFSDKATVSWRFAGNPNKVGKHWVTCMYLSRVVIGRTREQPFVVSSDPRDPVRNALYDNTRGYGGLLNPDAAYHTLRAADGSYFVVMDAMQCYPEYILFCEG